LFDNDQEIYLKALGQWDNELIQFPIDNNDNLQEGIQRIPENLDHEEATTPSQFMWDTEKYRLKVYSKDSYMNYFDWYEDWNDIDDNIQSDAYEEQTKLAQSENIYDMKFRTLIAYDGAVRLDLNTQILQNKVTGNLPKIGEITSHFVLQDLSGADNIYL
jgi:hypothetical protein